jgi:hypothetical protein
VLTYADLHLNICLVTATVQKNSVTTVPKYAEECDEHGMDHCEQCAKVCRDCSKICKEMVAK